jgi:hypothetical protein
MPPPSDSTPSTTGDPLDRRFRPAPRVVAREVDAETVLLDLASGRYFDLDDTGSWVWRRLAAGARLGEVVDELAAEYDAPRERLAADVVAFVAELERERLVVGD